MVHARRTAGPYGDGFSGQSQSDTGQGLWGKLYKRYTVYDLLIGYICLVKVTYVSCMNLLYNFYRDDI
jgi:hypothetical protein